MIILLTNLNFIEIINHCRPHKKVFNARALFLTRIKVMGGLLAVVAWRGGARQARGKGGISNGWGQGKEGGRESGDKWRLDPTRLRNSAQHADRRTEVGSEERRTQRESESESCSSSGGYYATQ